MWLVLTCLRRVQQCVLCVITNKAVKWKCIILNIDYHYFFFFFFLIIRLIQVEPCLGQSKWRSELWDSVKSLFLLLSKQRDDVSPQCPVLSYLSMFSCSWSTAGQVFSLSDALLSESESQLFVHVLLNIFTALFDDSIYFIPPCMKFIKWKRSFSLLICFYFNFKGVFRWDFIIWLPVLIGTFQEIKYNSFYWLTVVWHLSPSFLPLSSFLLPSAHLFTLPQLSLHSLTDIFFDLQVRKAVVPSHNNTYSL